MQGFTIYFESRNIRRKHNFCKDVLYVRVSQRYFSNLRDIMVLFKYRYLLYIYVVVFLLQFCYLF